MAGVVAAKMKEKKQREEEEEAKVNQFFQYWTIRISNNNNNKYQNQINPNWSEEEKELFRLERQKKAVFKVRIWDEDFIIKQ